MYKIAAITGGGDTPSAIYRLRALEHSLLENGIKLDEICPKISKYPPSSTLLRPMWLVCVLLERLTFIKRSSGYDAIILQRELVSTLPTFERLLPGKKILDVDDAIYMHRGGLAAINAAKASVGVVCGNEILAERFSNWNKNIEIIPTGVDLNQMKVVPSRLDDKNGHIIGWIGTPGNLEHVNAIADSLIKVLKNNKNCELRIITSDENSICSTLRKYVNFIKWRPGIEFAQIPYWTVGIMPLADNEWTQGKCSFKLLQYLSAGIPAIASPVGMNVSVFNKGAAGYLAKTNADWIDSLNSILADTDLNISMGLMGRKIAENHYSIQVVAQNGGVF